MGEVFDPLFILNPNKLMYNRITDMDIHYQKRTVKVFWRVLPTWTTIMIPV